MSLELNKIYCMDCLEGMKQIPDKSIDLVLTDPPYGINYQSNQKKEKYDKFLNDDNLNWLNIFFLKSHNLLKDNSHIYVFSGYKFIDVFLTEFKKYFDLKNILVIPTRHSGGVINDGHFRHSYELVLFGHKGKKGFNRMNKHPVKCPNDSRQKNKFLQLYPDLLNMFYANEFNLKQQHPTQKDVELIKHFIELSSNNGNIVLDPFMGSGTTAVACKQLGRDFIGFEISQDYVDISNKRLTQANIKSFIEGGGVK